MSVIVYETDVAIFSFERDEITQVLNRYKDRTQVCDDLFNLHSSSFEHRIKIPEECDYFSSIALDLLSENHWSVFYKLCGKIN